jgi:hypothetical protein
MHTLYLAWAWQENKLIEILKVSQSFEKKFKPKWKEDLE